MSRIDEAVSRILTIKYQADYLSLTAVACRRQFATAEAIETNRQAARESIVLAKNNNNILR